MMKTKDTFIQETMNSLEGIKRAEVTPFLYQKVMRKIQNDGETTRPSLLRWTIATLLLLISLNAFSILYQNKIKNTYSGGKAFRTEYFSYIHYLNF